jgi:hypothetical protein
VVAAVVAAAVVGGAVVGGAVVGGSVVGGAVVGGAVVGGSVVGGAVVGGSVVGGAVVGGVVVGGAVVGGVVVGGPVVVGGLVVGGGLVPDGGLVPGGAGTPATLVGPDGGLVSVVEMGLMDWISPPTPATTGNPPVGVGGWDEAPEDPAGGVPRLPLPPDLISGEEVSGDSFSAAPATAPPKLVHPGVQGLWSLRPNTSSRPMRATTVAAQARARRRSDGRQLIR